MGAENHSEVKIVFHKGDIYPEGTGSDGSLQIGGQHDHSTADVIARNLQEVLGLPDEATRLASNPSLLASLIMTSLSCYAYHISRIREEEAKPGYVGPTSKELLNELMANTFRSK